MNLRSFSIAARLRIGFGIKLIILVVLFFFSNWLGGQRSFWAMFVVCGVAGLVSMACAWYFADSITSPLSKAVGEARRIANGELTSHIEVTGKDEISELLQVLKD